MWAPRSAFAGRETARPGQAEHQLRHQERGPVVADGRRLVAGASAASCRRPRRWWPAACRGRRARSAAPAGAPFAAAQHQQHAGIDSTAPATCRRVMRWPKNSSRGQHPHRHARGHQRHVDRRGRLAAPGTAARCTCPRPAGPAPHSAPVRPQRAAARSTWRRERQQQHEGQRPAQEVQRERRHQLAHQPADDGIAGPQHGRPGEVEGGREVRRWLHGLDKAADSTARVASPPWPCCTARRFMAGCALLFLRNEQETDP
jgi:hypothetical protein